MCNVIINKYGLPTIDGSVINYSTPEGARGVIEHLRRVEAGDKEYIAQLDGRGYTILFDWLWNPKTAGEVRLEAFMKACFQAGDRPKYLSDDAWVENEEVDWKITADKKHVIEIHYSVLKQVGYYPHYTTVRIQVNEMPEALRKLGPKTGMVTRYHNGELVKNPLWVEC
jgi:hypothetical protein